MTAKNKIDVINSATSNLHTHHVLQSAILLCKTLKGTYYAYFHLHVFHSWTAQVFTAQIDAGPCWSLSVHPLSLLPQPVGHLFSDWLSSVDRRSDHISRHLSLTSYTDTSLKLLARRNYRHSRWPHYVKSREKSRSAFWLHDTTNTLCSDTRGILCFLSDIVQILRSEWAEAWLITTRPSPGKLAWLEML